MDVGARLRNAREARGMSIASLSAITRLAPRWLESIERNDPSAFPPGPYARGYVRSYAREVGLDPDEIAREYFAQFQAPPETAPAQTRIPQTVLPDEPRSSLSLIAPTIAAIGVLIALAGWAAWHNAPASRRERDAVGTSGQVGTPAASPVGTAAPPSGSPPEAAAPLTVTLTADEPAWITVTADGKRVLFRLLEPGAREVVRADRQLTIRVGNAGGVRWNVGGRDAGLMGTRGAVRTITITPENVTTVR